MKAEHRAMADYVDRGRQVRNRIPSSTVRQLYKLTA